LTPANSNPYRTLNLQCYAIGKRHANLNLNPLLISNPRRTPNLQCYAIGKRHANLNLDPC